MNKKAYIEKLNRNKRRKWPYIIGLILLFIGLLLAFSVKWIYDTYGNITIYSILYLINSPMSGTDSTYIISYIKQSLLPVLAIMVLIIFLTNNFYRKKYCINSKKGVKKDENYLVSIYVVKNGCLADWYSYSWRILYVGLL